MKLILAIVWIMNFILTESPHAEPAPLRVLINQGPATLNPRQTSDAIGQRIASLLFEGLTRVDKDLKLTPGLAADWTWEPKTKIWRFTVKPNLKDHNGAAISPKDIQQCLENYRTGKPTSVHISAFPQWIATDTKDQKLLLKLKDEDPFLPRNISLLRFFRQAGKSPCEDPKDPSQNPLIGSGPYAPAQGPLSQLKPENKIALKSSPQSFKNRRSLDFIFIRDENTRFLTLIGGRADAIYNSLTFSKTRYLKQKYAKDFWIITRDGVNVSYLAFNLNDPILANKNIRRAIQLAIPRQLITQEKYFNDASPASSLLSPSLPDYMPCDLAFDPEQAKKILAQENIKNLTLKYKTTSIREGFEQALLFKEYLKNIGITLEIQVVEPSVFLSVIKKGDFQLYSSRWVGVSDSSILTRTLRSGEPLNRVHYSSVEMDLAIQSRDYKKAQALMCQDLPYVPLWYWSNTLILRKTEKTKAPRPQDISLSGDFLILGDLREDHL